MAVENRSLIVYGHKQLYIVSPHPNLAHPQILSRHIKDKKNSCCTCVFSNIFCNWLLIIYFGGLTNYYCHTTHYLYALILSYIEISTEFCIKLAV